MNRTDAVKLYDIWIIRGDRAVRLNSQPADAEKAMDLILRFVEPGELLAVTVVTPPTLLPSQEATP